MALKKHGSAERLTVDDQHQKTAAETKPLTEEEKTALAAENERTDGPTET